MITKLPYSEKINTTILEQVFSKSTTSYKYFWMKAIFESLQQEDLKLNKKTLFTKMIVDANVFLNTHQLQFGSLDKLKNAFDELSQFINDVSISDKQTLEKCIYSSDNLEVYKILYHFDENVPYRFLSPWYPKMNKNEVMNCSQQLMNRPIYALYDEYIILDLEFRKYLLEYRNEFALFANEKWLNFLSVKNKTIDATEDMRIFF